MSIFPGTGHSDVLHETFEGTGFTPDGVLFYKDNEEQRAGRYEFQSKVVRSGKQSISLMVEQRCADHDKGCSERAELWERNDLRLPYGTGTWYGFSINVAKPVPKDNIRHVLAQWKRAIDRPSGRNSSPFFAIRMREGIIYATAETHLLEPLKNPDGSIKRVCDPGEARIWNRPEDGQSRIFVAANPAMYLMRLDEYSACTDQVTVSRNGFEIPDAESGWVDYSVYVEPDPEGNGRIEFFTNGKHIATVTGAIGHRNLGPNQYFKVGPYREGNEIPWTLHVDDFRRSSSCKDVLPAEACPF
ncbi:polysaccharide lyase [Coralliovum pocilloporae]|uniref:polysaccharide lyase n=1 Tax=Coralliovum pocilloporae TaxID=3066369 RepID=UPI00330794FB